MQPSIYDPFITYDQMQQLLELLTFFREATPYVIILLLANLAVQLAGAGR